MSYLVDTCGWIEWLIDGSLSKAFQSYLSEPTDLIVPVIIQYELFKWVTREKDQYRALEIIALTEQCHVIPLTTSRSLAAAEISGQHKLAMADAIIYTIAQEFSALLVTCDRHFKDMDNVKYLLKSTST